MKLGKGVPSVWPGYVAAIASLVLSLLLLLAILVFAMGQVGNMVAKYKPQIMRAALHEEMGWSHAAGQTAGAAPAPLPGATRSGSESRQPVAPKVSSQRGLQAIRLIFEAGVSDLAGPEAAELQEAVQQLRRPTDKAWLISAAVHEADAVNERNTLRLMLRVRQQLMGAGIDQKQIDVRLSKTDVAPEGRERGEIVISVRPVPGHADHEVKP